MNICPLAQVYNQRNTPHIAYKRLTGLQALFLICCTALYGVILVSNVSGCQSSVCNQASLGLALGITILMNLHVVHRFKALPLARSIPRRNTSTPTVGGNDDALPTYTVLVPLYQEGAIVQETVYHLTQLDYPTDKLQILLLIERDDADTLDALPELREHFAVIYVPSSWPRTKPKALNHGLQHATGELLTIYDAEDQPDPGQLRLAAAALSDTSENVWAVQAILRVSNPHDSWLSVLFFTEYAYWYEIYLPYMERIGAPLPLGGTSNHMPTRILRQFGGWDAFNVTEDADLATRIHHAGGKIKLLNSVTLETAPVKLKTWIRQRTRWVKGLMQTMLVHTRQRIAVRDLWYYLRTFGGTLLVVYTTCLILLLWSTAQHSLAHIAALVSMLCLALSVLLTLIMYVASLAQQRQLALLPTVIVGLLPYWFLYLIANVRALFQLIFNPFQWDKTNHGELRIDPKMKVV